MTGQGGIDEGASIGGGGAGGKLGLQGHFEVCLVMQHAFQGQEAGVVQKSIQGGQMGTLGDRLGEPGTARPVAGVVVDDGLQCVATTADDAEAGGRDGVPEFGEVVAIQRVATEGTAHHALGSQTVVGQKAPKAAGVQTL